MDVLLDLLGRLGSEGALAASDPRVSSAMLVAVVVGGVSLVFGVFVARRIGLLDRTSPAAETVGVGLGTGLIALTSMWAAAASSGRSSFTVVGVLFAVVLALAIVRPVSSTAVQPMAPDETLWDPEATPTRHLVGVIVAAAGFVLAIGLLYGATLAPSPRDGVQPVEFQDWAYYAVLGRNLANDRVESVYSVAGFDNVLGLPAQTWYHWGDIWLSASAITMFGLEPLLARSYVALPLLLAAAALMTGTLVRRATGTRSRWAFGFGALCCLFLAPIPLPGTLFSASWAGLAFTITTYGMAAIAVLLSVHVLLTLAFRRASPSLVIFAGPLLASVIPSHIVVAILGFVGACTAMLTWLVASLFGKSITIRSESARGPITVALWCSIVMLLTLAWGLLTGHWLTDSTQPSRVDPFNETWRVSVGLACLSAGVFVAILVAVAVLTDAPLTVRLLLAGSIAAVVFGALAWGARLGTFTMFHFMSAAVALIAVPVAAIAIRALWQRAQANGRRPVAVGIFAACAIQLSIGVIVTPIRLDEGKGKFAPWSVDLLASIRALPHGARLAYACNPMEELSYWNTQLISLDAHTGHHLVAMCFQADLYSVFVGAPLSADAPVPGFEAVPQRALYPDSRTRLSDADVLAFLKRNHVEYIYADRAHPNNLVPDAIVVASGGGAELLRIR